MVEERAVHAMILTGGRSSRMGGRHKPGINIGGRSVIDRTVATLWSAVPQARVIIAGSADGLSRNFRQRCRVVREDPPFSGPFAGVAAAVHALPSDARTVLLFGGDLPFLSATTVTRLTQAVAAGADVASCLDTTGHLQYLVSGWHSAVLRQQIDRIADPQGVPLRALFDGLEPQLIDCDPQELRDIDTPADLARAVTTADGRPVPEALVTALESYNRAAASTSEVLPVEHAAELLEFARAVKHAGAPVNPVVAAFLAGQTAGNAAQDSVSVALRMVLDLVEMGEHSGQSHTGRDDSTG